MSEGPPAFEYVVPVLREEESTVSDTELFPVLSCPALSLSPVVCLVS